MYPARRTPGPHYKHPECSIQDQLQSCCKTNPRLFTCMNCKLKFCIVHRWSLYRDGDWCHSCYMTRQREYNERHKDEFQRNVHEILMAIVFVFIYIGVTNPFITQ